MATIALRKLGNSVGLGVPKSILESLGLSTGSKVKIELVGNKIVIEPSRRVYDINELVKGMNPDNQEPEMFATAMGSEVI